MITDTELKILGVEALIKTLGELNAERFISLLLREAFDYTQWQRVLWTEKSIEEISQMAMDHRADTNPCEL